MDGSTAVTGLQYGGGWSSYPRPSDISGWKWWRNGNDAEADDRAGDSGWEGVEWMCEVGEEEVLYEALWKGSEG